MSGFLITGILLDTRDSPAYFRNFYGRRVIRILPPYYLFLFIWFVVLPFVPALDPGWPIGEQLWYWRHAANVRIVAFGDPLDYRFSSGDRRSSPTTTWR